MRIISGTHKGRRIQIGSNFKARPTTDFAKETLFNVLQNLYDFENLSVLDLFGGTGSISYEFASRGAKVTTVEKNSKHYNYIKKNQEILNFNNIITTVKADVFKLLPKLQQQYDIIFADPPFALEQVVDLPNIIFNSSLLQKEGLFILEHSSANNFSKHPHFKRLVTRGSVNFSFFE